MDQQKVSQLVLIYLSSAFDTVGHDIWLNIMNCTFGVTDTAVSWFNSYHLSRSQRICIIGIVSEQFKLYYGVPQGSCLGPVEFTKYCIPLFSIINQHGKLGHAYADDHQVYCSFHPDSMNINHEPMERCISDISTWMEDMKLKLSHSKTEYILIGIPQQLPKCTNMAINIGGNEIQSLNCVRNLGAYFDKHMTMEQHVKSKCRAAYAQLYNIGNVRIFLDHQSAKRLIHALVYSHIDYCNALLIGLPKNLIQKKKTAARMLCRIGKYNHIPPTLKSLHWLSVEFHI